MTQTLFDFTFYLAAPFWALMIFLPGWPRTQRIVRSPWIAVPPLVLYVVLLAPIFGDFAAAMVNPSLPTVNEVVGTVNGSAALWAHLIAFDLFVGRWMYFDSRERHVHSLVMAPILLLTILLSPFGLITYLIVRAITGRCRRR